MTAKEYLIEGLKAVGEAFAIVFLVVLAFVALVLMVFYTLHVLA